MIRPRKKDRHLPPCVYHKHGAYWLMKRGKWLRLGTNIAEALREYARVLAPSSHSMRTLLDRWLDGARPKLKPKSIRLYEQAAKRIADVFAEFDPRQIKPRDVAQWIDHESRRPAWANRLRGVLKLAMDKAVLWGLADSNPVLTVPKASEPKRTRYITDAEFRAIRAKAGPQLRCIVDLCYLTAQRIGDVIAIRHGDLTDTGISFEQEKTGARLTVAWSPDLRQVLAAIRALPGNVRGLYLVAQRNGKPYSYGAIYAAWSRACKAAGVRDAHIHDLRAKALTDAKAQGIDAQALAGHTSAKQTEHYIKQRAAPIVQAPSFRQMLDN